jgi:hypothetical protein
MHLTLMTPARLFIALALVVSSAFAQSDDKAFLERLESTFEPGGVIEANRFLSPDVMSGPLHKVASRAYNDGLNNTYFLLVNGTEIEVTGTLALRTRVRELYATEALRNTNKSEEFRKAITAAGKEKLEGAANIVKDPVGTITSIPKGASRFFGRIGEGLKGGKSEGQDTALQGITGVSAAKAKLAAQLGVSPYSTNEELQRELNATARAMAGGGLIINAASSFATGGAGAALTVVGVNQTLQDTLASSTPEDLRILNRKKLFALGVTREQADELLMHPWYSPWHATIITDALSTIGVDPSAYLREACRAITPEDALYFQRIAQVLARYSSAVPVGQLTVVQGVVCAVDRNNNLIVPLSCDYAIWAERSARRAEEFSNAFPQSGYKSLALWVDGKVSDRLAEQLTKRKIAVRPDVLGAQ